MSTHSRMDCIIYIKYYMRKSTLSSGIINIIYYMWCNRADTTRTTQIFLLKAIHSQYYPLILLKLTYTIYMWLWYIQSQKKNCNLGVVFIVIDMHHYIICHTLYVIWNTNYSALNWVTVYIGSKESFFVIIKFGWTFDIPVTLFTSLEHRFV